MALKDKEKVPGDLLVLFNQGNLDQSTTSILPVKADNAAETT